MSTPSCYFDEPLRAGDSFYIEVSYDDSTCPAGFVHTFTMRPDWGDDPVLQVTKTVPAEPDYGTDPRKVYIRLAPEETSLLEPGKYVFDLQVYVPETEDVVTIAPYPSLYNKRIRVVPQVTTNDMS